MVRLVQEKAFQPAKQPSCSFPLSAASRVPFWLSFCLSGGSFFGRLRWFPTAENMLNHQFYCCLMRGGSISDGSNTTSDTEHTIYIYKQDRGLVGVLLTSGVLQCHLGIAELAEEWGLPVEARSQDPTLWICEVTNRHGQALACHSHIANGRNNAACCSLLVRLSNYIGVSWCIQSDSWK